MTKPKRIGFRLLGLAHVAIAIILLPAVMFLGVLSLVVVTPALVWLAILGFRLWRPSCRLRTPLRHTHRVLLPFSILLVTYGLFALGAAQRSAETGGGLLGGFGLIPIVMGLLAGSLSIVSLHVCHSTAFEKMTGTAQGVEGDAERLAS